MKTRAAVLAAVWILSALYTGLFLDRGWVPHDEGMLAQNAERVLRGELPHRDFDESYTGGLNYAHALAFRLFGIHLLSSRFVLFAFFLAFVPALYAIASRLLPPLPAGLLTLLGVAWSVPNYFASMPSWYVLFFATLGALALLRALDTGRKGWLFAAGLCGGLALLAIVVGLYFVAAALLFLAFREQIAAEAGDRTRERSSFAFAVFQTISCAAFAALLLFLLRSRLAPTELAHLGAPALAVTGILVWRGWKERRGEFRERLRLLLGLVLPFLLGVLAPVALFVLPYLLSDATGDLPRGLFVLPLRQIDVAKRGFPPFATLGAAIPYAVLLVVSARVSRRSGRLLAWALALLLALLLLATESDAAYRSVWHSARSLSAVAVLVGGWMLARSFESSALSSRRQQELFLLLAMTALVSLVQFPFAAPIYFCYVAPFVALCLAAIVRIAPGAFHLPVLAFYLLFALLRLNPGYIWDLGVRSVPYRPLARLALDRGGLRVPARDRVEYEALVAAIRKRSRGPFVYAAPDCPEVYFLSGRLNPTRVVFDFLRRPPKPEVLLALLEERMVHVVVLNRNPAFSEPVPGELRAALERRFPRSEGIGRFLLRWRDPASSAGGSD